MKTLAAVLLLAFVAVAAALLAVRDPGYVLITREPLVLETSLAVFVLLLGAAFVALYFAVRLVVRIVRAPRDLARWRQARRTRKAREAFHNGLTSLIEGRWLEAEKSLLASLHAADSPFLAHLATALAAQGQNDPDKRDEYLARAHEHAGQEILAANLAQARLQLAAGQHERALATLARVRAHDPAQPEAVRLLARVYRRLRDWQDLAQLLAEARRNRILPPAELEALELETQRALLGLPLPAGALDPLHRAWAAVPEHLREHPELILVYARQLLELGAADECAGLLAALLDRRWDERLVRLYGEARGTQPAAQLETAEEWLARHGEGPVLLLTLGRLARRARLATRARGYLEKSLALGPGREAHAELAALYEEGGDTARALEHYRQALARDAQD